MLNSKPCYTNTISAAQVNFIQYYLDTIIVANELYWICAITKVQRATAKQYLATNQINITCYIKYKC